MSLLLLFPLQPARHASLDQTLDQLTVFATAFTNTFTGVPSTLWRAAARPWDRRALPRPLRRRVIGRPPAKP